MNSIKKWDNLYERNEQFTIAPVISLVIISLISFLEGALYKFPNEWMNEWIIIITGDKAKRKVQAYNIWSAEWPVNLWHTECVIN